MSSQCWSTAFTCYPYGTCSLRPTKVCTQLGNECEKEGDCVPVDKYPDTTTETRCRNLFTADKFAGVRKACVGDAYSSKTLRISSGKWKCSNDPDKKCGHDCGIKSDLESQDAFEKRCQEQADRTCSDENGVPGSCVRSCDADSDCAQYTDPLTKKQVNAKLRTHLLRYSALRSSRWKSRKCVRTRARTILWISAS